MSANYNPLELQQNDSYGSDQISPINNESGGASSILDRFRQAEVDKRNADYQEALNLVKQNKFKEAREKISALLKETHGESQLYVLQGFLETQEKNTLAAQQSYQKALERDPKNILAYFGLAKIYLEAGDLNKAKDFANQALWINDKMAYSYLLLADIAFQQKQYAEMERVLLAALEKVKGDIAVEIEVIKNLGRLYAVQKQPEKFLSLCEDLAKRYPNNSQAMSALAGAQIVNNKKDLAEQTLRQLINQEKQDANNRLLLARLLIAQPDKEKEILQLLDDAAAIEPNNSEPIVFKVAYLVKLQRYPEALELANKADKLFPKLILGKVLRGDVYLADKKGDKALESYQQAYKLQPNDRVLFAIADLLNAQKNLPEALDLLNKALEKNPKNVTIHFKLATAYQHLNDTAQAEKHYQAILAEQPENVLALNNLAWLYDQQNNPLAMEFAKRAYAKAPDSAPIADTYGYILIKQGQSAEGLTVLEKAASLAPTVNDIQFHLAEAYVATINKSKAIEILMKITKAQQNFSEKKPLLIC